jgi:hypothetical protein
LGAGGRRFKSCRPDHEGFAVHDFQFMVRCLETAVHALTAAIATTPLRDSDESHQGSPHLETVLTVRSRTETGNRERRTVELRTLFRVAKASDLGIFAVLRNNRAVAQLGSALEWGSRGRGFESRRPDNEEPKYL